MELTLKNVENIVEDNMGQFSTYVLLSRAIPDIRDGLKPSYRRVLWTMNEMKAIIIYFINGVIIRVSKKKHIITITD